LAVSWIPPFVPELEFTISTPLSLCTVLVDLKQVPLGQAPFLHYLRRSVVPPCGIEEPLFGGFSGPMGLSDCSEAYTLVLRPLAFPSRTDSETLRQSFSELSRLPHMERMHMQQVSDSGELN
jgi:hypothetical protein